MKICEAMSKKLLKICDERGISVINLRILLFNTKHGSNIIECNSVNPKLLTIVRICDGLNMTLEEFFSDELFSNIDRED